jgi:hypothetical protein
MCFLTREHLRHPWAFDHGRNTVDISKPTMSYRGSGAVDRNIDQNSIQFTASSKDIELTAKYIAIVPRVDRQRPVERC